ncbi:hypothetical protein RSal33209_2523 [Renibacterium salmoninarum ATCC 33209]|uniref:Uncharacterized protein n=1 Tax=Renibacterium salmoninarum (strain ATCC 33209 / DSM 20767 / JCM 11484 / NBRC 15589 / NCIMB 2235) TaxID=288705 RepID=A9WRG7_RENSM|nr:hypothetical protein RSal33209_2523 [Renibacterium salmoninarum ATCC 33209]
MFPMFAVLSQIPTAAELAYRFARLILVASVTALLSKVVITRWFISS